MKCLRSFAAICLLLTAVGMAQAQDIIYQHDFNGSSSEPLHGLAPDIDNSGLGTTWVTRTDTGLPDGSGVRWYADGSLDETLAGNGAASLAFTPQPGNVYTLTVGFNAFTGPDTFWTAIGYSSGQATGTGGGADFFGNGQPDQVTGQGWMIYRVAGTVHPGQTFLGDNGTNSTAGGENWPTQVVANPGDPVIMRVVLDTTAPIWEAEWLAKTPADVDFTSLRTAPFIVNPTSIAAISIAANEQLDGRLDFLSLTVTPVPEPGTALLAALGLPVVMRGAARRRRR
jgi:hypothetical protein